MGHQLGSAPGETNARMIDLPLLYYSNRRLLINHHLDSLDTSRSVHLHLCLKPLPPLGTASLLDSTIGDY